MFGGPDMHVHEGSLVNISCIVQNTVGPPEFFFWYQNGKVSLSWCMAEDEITIWSNRLV